MLPDQGLLMTYGLFPRYTQDQVVHWDDLQGPQYDLITADSSTSSLFREPGQAFVEADASLVQDYSSLRGLSVVQVFYVETAATPSEHVQEILGDERQIDVELPGRSVSLKRIPEGRVLAQCWGIRLVLEPGSMPLTDGRWDYAELEWPGAGVVSAEDARMAGIADHASEVFVRDTVLARFEGQPDIEIHPDSGAVSYRNQWAVGWCQRYGRDLIRVDLKKLYEGNPPEIVAHYHEHAVEPPPLDDRRWDEPNVGSRAARIAFAWADLGEAVAILARALGIPVRSGDLVGVERADLEYRGWWSDNEFEITARHILPGLSADAFVDRCGAIYRSTVDRLKESTVRRIVLELGFDPDALTELGSLKLLELVVAAASLAIDSGLDFVDQREEIVRRVAQNRLAQLSGLFKLNDLRQLSGHAQTDRHTKMGEILWELGIDPGSAAGGYDFILDSIYDIVGDAIKDISECLFRSLEG